MYTLVKNCLAHFMVCNCAFGNSIEGVLFTCDMQVCVKGLSVLVISISLSNAMFIFAKVCLTKCISNKPAEYFPLGRFLCGIATGSPCECMLQRKNRKSFIPALQHASRSFYMHFRLQCNASKKDVNQALLIRIWCPVHVLFVELFITTTNSSYVEFSPFQYIYGKFLVAIFYLTDNFISRLAWLLIPVHLCLLQLIRQKHLTWYVSVKYTSTY